MDDQRRLLIVEDEPLISLLAEQMAIELGWTVEGSAYTEREALALLETSAPTLALLDLNLGGGTTSLEIAAACRARNIPIVFSTGYSPSHVPAECGDAPILGKPFSPEELAAALSRATEGVQPAYPSCQSAASAAFPCAR